MQYEFYICGERIVFGTTQHLSKDKSAHIAHTLYLRRQRTESERIRIMFDAYVEKEQSKKSLFADAELFLSKKAFSKFKELVDLSDKLNRKLSHL